LGATGVKAVRKYVGEINIRRVQINALPLANEKKYSDHKQQQSVS